MKFGKLLKSSIIREYCYYYISYDELKARLSGSSNWSETEEETFVAILEGELDKVYTFQKVKTGEISRRIKQAEKEVKAVIRAIESDHPPDDESFDDLEEELSDIIADVHDLAKFINLNYTGFYKILKKHDKQTGWTLKPIFAVRLNAKPFFKENYDALVVKLSDLYNLVRTRGNPAKGDASAGSSQQNFVRQTTKYWIHKDNITELKLIILKHLPVLVFNANKEFEPEDNAITSIYFDNKNLDLYKGRLEKSEGAEAIRLRWYGGMSSDTIFIERKTHREDWTGEKSVKARFTLKEKHVNDFLKGKYTVADAFEKMRAEGKKSLKEIESLETLAREVQYAVIKKRLRPVVRSFYNRTAFQLPGDARVRISLDTELTMVREDNFDGVDRTEGNWRRLDIGVDWPFSQLPDSDVDRFPYAVLEVKLQTQLGQEPPQWVRDLVSSHLVEAVPKFSKFIHGASTLFPDRITQIPFWLPQMNVDIRKPKKEEYGIAHPDPGTSSGLDDEDDDDDESEFMDEEQALETRRNTQPGAVSFVREDAETQLDQEADDTTPLLATSGQRRASAALFQSRIFNGIKPFIHWFKEAFVTPTNVSTLPQGTMFLENIEIPKGKTLCVPVRVEPKVYFANERTFLAWLEIGILLSAIAGGLLNFGDPLALQAAVGFFIVAFLAIVYSICIYIWRVRLIRNKAPARYDDQYGPTVICIALSAATGVNFLMRADS